MYVTLYAILFVALLQVTEPSKWLGYVAIALGTVILPALVSWLKPLWHTLPALVKTLVPVIVGPLLVVGSTALSKLLGAPVDLTVLEQIWMGAAVGLNATLAFKQGEKKAA